MNDVQLILIVIGLVAVTCRWVPKVDGVLVAVAAVIFAVIASTIAAPCELAAGLCRGVVAGLTAFGVMTAVRYATRKLDCLCKGDDHTAPASAPTGDRKG
jgi:putative effector of murein hydrolase